MNLERKRMKALKSTNKSIKKRLEEVGIYSHYESYRYVNWDELEAKSFDYHELKLDELVDYYKREKEQEMIKLVEEYNWLHQLNHLTSETEESEYSIVFNENKKEVNVYDNLRVYPEIHIEKEEKKEEIENYLRLKGYQAELKSVELKSTFDKKEGEYALYKLIDQINDELSGMVSKVNSDLKDRILKIMKEEEKMHL